MPGTLRLHLRAASLAVLAVAFLALWSASAPAARPAHADTTGVVVIGCEFIANAIDGDTTDALTEDDVAAACGRANTPLPAVAAPAIAASEIASPFGCSNAVDDDADGIINDGCPQSIQRLAQAIGDKDGALELSDFSGGSVDESWDDNQISTNCYPGLLNFASAVWDYTLGLACTLDVFSFVDQRGPTSIDLPTGLATIENGLEDFVCTTDFDNLVPPATPTIQTDNDCESGAPIQNSDGVVLFHVLLNPATYPIPAAGAALVARVSQSSVEHSFPVNVVGPATSVLLSLAESLIETNGSTANVNACRTTTPLTGAIDPPTSTLARATVKDAADRVLTRVPIYFTVPAGQADIAATGLGDPYEGIVSNTLFSIDPTAASEPTAASVVICGGKLAGAAAPDAAMFLQDCAVDCGSPTPPIHSSQPLTVGGTPVGIGLAAAPTSVLCDGIATTTITASVTDTNGAPVADGVPVHFSVSLVGITTPVDTVTAGGSASTTFKGLSAATVGVPVTAIAGNSGIATPAQSQILIPCNGFDTDGDGLPNVFESANLCLNPSVSDSGGDPDVDGLTSLNEFGRGTSPCVADSDGDGYDDGVEVGLGENPLAYCAIMRADVDGDHAVGILDLGTVAQRFLQSIPPAPARLNQDGDTKISILDLATMSTSFLKHTPACP